MNDKDIETPVARQNRDYMSPTAATDALRDRLFQARKLIISGEVTQRLAADVMAQLLAMEAESETEPITVFINSQGGHVESGDTIHDMVRFVRAPVRMVGTGWEVGS